MKEYSVEIGVYGNKDGTFHVIPVFENIHHLPTKNCKCNPELMEYLKDTVEIFKHNLLV